MNSHIPIIQIVNIFASFFFFCRKILKPTLDIITFLSQIFQIASLKKRGIFCITAKTSITTNKSNSNFSVSSNTETIFRFPQLFKKVSPAESGCKNIYVPMACDCQVTFSLNLLFWGWGSAVNWGQIVAASYPKVMKYIQTFEFGSVRECSYCTGAQRALLLFSIFFDLQRRDQACGFQVRESLSCGSTFLLEYVYKAAQLPRAGNRVLGPEDS